jgi:hypothetical protein
MNLSQSCLSFFFRLEICQGLNEANQVAKKIKAWKIGERTKFSRTFFVENFALIIKKKEKSKNYFYCSYKLCYTLSDPIS